MSSRTVPAEVDAVGIVNAGVAGDDAVTSAAGAQKRGLSDERRILRIVWRQHCHTVNSRIIETANDRFGFATAAER
jgi:hypothetical protein